MMFRRIFGIVLTIALAGAHQALAQETPPEMPGSAPATTSTTTTTTSAPDNAEEGPDDGMPDGHSDYRVRLDVKESRFTLALYGQLSQFTYQNRPLIGNSLELAASYAVFPQIAATVAVGQAVTLEGGISILYTNFHAAMTYALSGSFIQRKSVLVVNGLPTVSAHSGEGNLLALDIGLDQFMFNGTNRIVPGTGIVFGVRYDKKMWGLDWSAALRYGALIISENATSMTTAGLGMMMRF